MDATIDVYSAKESHKKEDIADFLYEIRGKNPEKTIVLIWDNAKAHWSRMVRRTAQLLDIILVFLPPYSPDINPIEYVWKSMDTEIPETIENLIGIKFFRSKTIITFSRCPFL